MKKVKITKQELISMLKNWKYGAQPCSIQMITKPKLNKLGKSKFGNVIKIANVGGMMGYCYENSVNTQQKREGVYDPVNAFIAQPLWNGKGKRINPVLSQHVETNKMYLSYKFQQTFKSLYLDKDLNVISYKDLKGCFYDNTPKNQGVETPVLHREVSIENIRKIKIKKTTYEIIENVELKKLVG